jgi:hypothetical protein
MAHTTLQRAASFWRVKLGPKSPIWTEYSTLWGDDGLQPGSPSSSLAFAFTIQPWVRTTSRRLAEVGDCARFGTDDGYLVGPRESIIKVLEDFTKGIREET